MKRKGGEERFYTEVVSAKFVMKTDDDAFVRVDEVLASVDRINVTQGLAYGLINSDSQPHCNPESKWYISPEMFKLEDVAMGIWIAEMKDILKVRYENDDRIHNEGCKDGYVVAHYQDPREMLCLWQKIQEGNGARCCGDP